MTRGLSVCIYISHEDGSVRFWDVSSAGIRLLYKLMTADMFGGYYRGDMSDIDADEEWPPFRKVVSLTSPGLSLVVLLLASERSTGEKTYVLDTRLFCSPDAVFVP